MQLHEVQGAISSGCQKQTELTILAYLPFPRNMDISMELWVVPMYLGI